MNLYIDHPPLFEHIKESIIFNKIQLLLLLVCDAYVLTVNMTTSVNLTSICFWSKNEFLESKLKRCTNARGQFIGHIKDGMVFTCMAHF